MSLRADFIAFDDELASKGVPPLTGWWRDGIGKWLDAYELGNVLELWACVGRGAAKSTAMYKLATFLALFGAFTIPPGEVHYAIVLSRLKEEATKGVAIIARWLALLGVRHRRAGDVIELTDQPRGIRVVAASVAAATGWRAFAVFKDERAKWGTGGAEETDADEVDTSANAMTATHARAPFVTMSSTWAASGSFYDAITGGTTETRHVLGPAPTWIAAPHVSEAETRKKERDERRWKREYACQFQAGASCAFDADAINRAFAHTNTATVRGAPVLIVDPSSGGADSFTWCLARYCSTPQQRWVTRKSSIHGQVVTSFVTDMLGRRIPDPSYDPGADRPFIRVERFGAIEGGFWGKLGGDAIVEKIAAIGKQHGAAFACGDQRERLMLASAFSRYGMRYVPIDWTATSKPAAVELCRDFMREGLLSLEKNERLRSELLTFEERFSPSGQLTFGARGRAHDDHVALLVTLAHAWIEGFVPSAPSRTRRYLPTHSAT